LWGDGYPLPFTLLIKVERAVVEPKRSASSSSFSALSTSPFHRLLNGVVEVAFGVVQHRLGFFAGRRSGAATAAGAAGAL
jgi:hypothetical protein